MINNISWTSYWQTIAIILLIYYLGIVYVYYRKDLLSYFTASKDAGYERTLRNITEGQTVSEYDIDDSSISIVDKKESPETFAEPVIDEIKAYFNQVSHVKKSKDAVLRSLHAILKKYPLLEETVKVEITQLIRNEAAELYPIIINDDDIDGVWLGL